MNKLGKKINYVFKDVSLLETALTHSSFANENRKSGVICNERLEFLGDSILGMTVADYLYRIKPEMPEGQMTRLRAELVCEQSLVTIANELGLGAYLRLGHGEEQGGGRSRPSILADAVEAVLAAVYLDGGQKQAAAIIKRYVLNQLESSGETVSSDYKTALQELVQKKSGQTLIYRLKDESGPDHLKVFTVEVCLNGNPMGEGSGKSKKEAEQSAANAALEAMTK